MITINIKEDFSPTTGFRTYEDGPKSGLEFYETLLKEKFENAIRTNDKLKIILDGGEGYTSSFLNEAFMKGTLSRSSYFLGIIFS